MKRYVHVAIIIGLVMVLPAAASAADAYDAYMQLMDHHYFLDRQKINRVTCRVVLSSLDPAKMREQLKPFGKNVVLDGDLKDFTVSYSKKDGITFHEPHFKVVLLSAEGAKDPARLEQSIKLVNNGIQKQIAGAMQIIRGVLEDFVSPEKRDLKNLEVLSVKGVTTVKYDKDGASYAEVYVGKTKTTTIMSSGSDIKAKEVFTALDGKLVPAKATAQMHQGDYLINTDITIQYQNPGKLFFPAVLDQHLQMTGPSFKQEGRMKISFVDCLIE